MNRKKMIVNKKFQLRAILSVAVIAMFFFSVVIGVISFFSLRNKTNISAEITMLESAVETQNNIVNAFVEYSAKNRQTPVKLSVDTVSKDHKKSMDTITRHVSMLERYTDDYFYLIVITIGITILVILAYYIYMIRLTHRISGPIFVMSQHIQAMIEGREPHFRSLREKDEFKEMYAKLVELGGKLKRK